MGFQTNFLESGQSSDHETNMYALAADGYNFILTVSSSMGDAAASKAKQYPDIKFAIIDNSCTITGLAHVTSLMFAEDQVGFLAGGMSKCDFVFAVGGDTVNGVLLAARESNLPAIGADVDECSTDPEAQSALISSAMKNVDIAVYNYLKAVADGSVKAGISTLKNGGVGLAPSMIGRARSRPV
ncbi:MAG TPA: BMP family ABC transporter substrate-binding protein [Anaerolineales bacterium]|nr:BMP family ABC transporter substrate-binding protein [Anaerolineales bacterium]